MKRFFGLLLSVWLGTTLLSAQTVARVGDQDITGRDVANELINTDSQLSDAQRRNDAREALIHRLLLNHWADANNITVSEYELEQYISTKLGNDSQITTDGVFDEDKYAALRSDPAWQTYFENAREALRQQKTRDGIEAAFDISEDDIQQAYIRDVFRVDLSYILIDAATVDVNPELTPEGARDFYRNHPERYRLSRQAFALQLDRPGLKTATLSGNHPSTWWQRMLTWRTLPDLTNPQPIPFNEGSFRFVPGSLDGLLPLTAAARQVWTDYHDQYLFDHLQGGLEDYYRRHSADYSDRATICRVVILDPQTVTCRTEFTEAEIKDWYDDHRDRYRHDGQPLALDTCRHHVAKDLSDQDRNETVTIVKARLLNGMSDDDALSDLVRRYHLISRQDTVFVNRYPNPDSLDQRIALDLRKKSATQGVLQVGDLTVGYRVLSEIPDYTPSFAVIRDQVFHNVRDKLTEDTNVDYHAFYDDIKDNFTVPDSLMLAVAWFPFGEKKITVTPDELDDAYVAHHDELWMDEGYTFDAIYYRDPNQFEDCRLLQQSLRDSTDFALCAATYGRPRGIQVHEPLSAESIPEPIRSALRDLSVGQVSSPLRWQGGYLIVRKEADNSGDYLSRSAAAPMLTEQLQRTQGVAKAREDAKAFLTGAPTLDKVPANAILNRIPRQDIAEVFPFAGDLMPYRASLLRLNDGQVLNQIVTTDSGCAVVYLVSRNRVKPSGYQELLPLIKQAWHEQNRDQRAREFLNHLISDLRADGQTEVLLGCFGDWWSLKNLTIDDSLPGIPNSNRILRDLRNRRPGEIMPPLKANATQYMLLRVDRVQKTSKEDYDLRKDDIRAQLTERRFQRWLKDYEAQVGVVRY